MAVIAIFKKAQRTFAYPRRQKKASEGNDTPFHGCKLLLKPITGESPSIHTLFVVIGIHTSKKGINLYSHQKWGIDVSKQGFGDFNFFLSYCAKCNRFCKKCSKICHFILMQGFIQFFWILFRFRWVQYWLSQKIYILEDFYSLRNNNKRVFDTKNILSEGEIQPSVPTTLQQVAPSIIALGTWFADKIIQCQISSHSTCKGGVGLVEQLVDLDGHYADSELSGLDSLFLVEKKGMIQGTLIGCSDFAKKGINLGGPFKRIICAIDGGRHLLAHPAASNHVLSLVIWKGSSDPVVLMYMKSSESYLSVKVSISRPTGYSTSTIPLATSSPVPLCCQFQTRQLLHLLHNHQSQATLVSCGSRNLTCDPLLWWCFCRHHGGCEPQIQAGWIAYHSSYLFVEATLCYKVAYKTANGYKKSHYLFFIFVAGLLPIPFACFFYAQTTLMALIHALLLPETGTPPTLSKKPKPTSNTCHLPSTQITDVSTQPNSDSSKTSNGKRDSPNPRKQLRVTLISPAKQKKTLRPQL
ncbi:hypothetical protein VP01_3102g1 [Puccinia sorghi]|uniref:Uncharacterized protein n=1 Tax=Puccinia sorghi TaxID=27349 RepID=A0A0L6UZK3_9BASI|nr:hypothetical protein VP01_3102g1 [Puccinia sorghi]